MPRGPGSSCRPTAPSIRGTSLTAEDRDVGKRRKKDRGRLDPQARMRRIYDARDGVLRSMGFRDYRDYLASPLWREIRARVLRKRPECRLCGGTATQVHHTKYLKGDLYGTRLDNLIPLCGGCHRRIEFRDRDGLKLNTKQATAKLKILVDRNRKRREAEERLKDQVIELLLS